MPFNPTLCPDCSYPPNFSYVRLPGKENGFNKIEVSCRDCDDIWVEIDVDDSLANEDIDDA